MRLEVSSSVVSTQLQTLKMPVDGVVRLINFKQGEHVKAGDKLLMIDDLKLERQISAAKLKIVATKKALWQMKQKHRIEKERLKLYRIVSRTDKSIALARLSSLRVALNAADAHFLRITKLKKSGAATATQYDEAKKTQALAVSAVREGELLLEKNTAMEAASTRRHYNHKEFTTDLDLLAVNLAMAYSALEIELRKLQQLEEIKAKYVLRAPFDGRIVNLYQSASANVIRNEPLLLLERDNGTSVTAYLNQKEILEVGLFDEAKVFIPALNRHMTAVVTKIDRSSLYLNKNATQYIWRDDKDRTAAVTLELQVDKPGSSQIRAGLPVVVIFDRRETNDIWSRIKGFVGGKPKVERESEPGQKI